MVCRELEGTPEPDALRERELILSIRDFFYLTSCDPQSPAVHDMSKQALHVVDQLLSYRTTSAPASPNSPVASILRAIAAQAALCHTGASEQTSIGGLTGDWANTSLFPFVAGQPYQFNGGSSIDLDVLFGSCTGDGAASQGDALLLDLGFSSLEAAGRGEAGALGFLGGGDNGLM